jgi:hypothetical protein
MDVIVVIIIGDKTGVSYLIVWSSLERLTLVVSRVMPPRPDSRPVFGISAVPCSANLVQSYGTDRRDALGWLGSP